MTEFKTPTPANYLDSEQTRLELKQWTLAAKLNYEDNPEWFEAKAAELSSFLAQHNLWPPFRAIEILVNSLNEAVLHSPDYKFGYFTADKTGRPQLKHWLTTAKWLLNFRRPDGSRLPNVEAAAEIRSVFDLGQNLKMVSLAMNPGPDQDGQPAPARMMSFVMAEKNAGGTPFLVSGKTSELTDLLTSNQERQTKFEPLRFSQSLMTKLNHDLDTVEELFGGKRVRLPEKMVVNDDSLTNVKSYEIFWESSAFHTTIVFTKKDGSKIPCLINKAEMVTESEMPERLQEGSAYWITTMIEGKLYVAAIEMNRLQGFPGKFRELPRGFAKILDKLKSSCLIATGETGLSEADILANQTKPWINLAQDTRFENVLTQTRFIHLPSVIALSNQQVDMPAKQVEELHPGWLEVENLIQEIAAGAGFADAHSLSIIGHWLISEQVISLKEIATTESLLFESTQDWRTGFARLTLLRTSQNQPESQTSFSKLPGLTSPNSGSARIHEQIASNTNPAEVLRQADQAKKDLIALSLPEILVKLAAGEFDIATMAAITKFLLQQGKVNIDTSKFRILKSQ